VKGIAPILTFTGKSILTAQKKRLQP